MAPLWEQVWAASTPEGDEGRRPSLPGWKDVFFKKTYINLGLGIYILAEDGKHSKAKMGSWVQPSDRVNSKDNYRADRLGMLVGGYKTPGSGAKGLQQQWQQEPGGPHPGFLHCLLLLSFKLLTQPPGAQVWEGTGMLQSMFPLGEKKSYFPSQKNQLLPVE